MTRSDTRSDIGAGAGGAAAAHASAAPGHAPSARTATFTERQRVRLREALLDAAAAMIRENGWRATRMADVAAAAGVSRQTLYQYFGSREALEAALVLREADRFLREVEQAVDNHADNPHEALAAAFEVFRAAVARNPLITSIIVRDGSGELMSMLDAHGTTLLDTARDRLEAVCHAAWPEVARADHRLLTEAVVRLGISHLTMPGSSSALTGAGVARLLGPFVARAVRQSAAHDHHT